MNGVDWSVLIAGNWVTLANVGDRVAIRAKTTNQRMATSYSTTYANHFGGSGALKISGNINSLLNKNPEEVTSLPTYAFGPLFAVNSSVRDAGQLQLPATSLGTFCYCRLF